MKQRKALLLIVMIGLTVFFLPNCSPVATDDDGSEIPESYSSSDESLYVEHTKGTSPCPQKVGDVAIYPEGSRNGLDRADSVVIENTDPGLEVKFGSTGTNTAAIGPEDNNPTAEVYFDCVPPQSVDATLTVKIYRDGAVVAEEKVQVDVIVL